MHELGHLIIAKLCKCKVEVFSIGFGKKIIGKQLGNTYYQIAWLPLGGYNKLKDETKLSNDPFTFTNLKYRYKFLIAVAGCFINILTGLVTILISSYLHIKALYIFGFISLSLGIGNLLPIAQCIDGGYIVYMPIYLKVLGKEKGIKKFNQHCKVSFKILMLLNIASIIYLIIYGIIFFYSI